MSNFPFSNSSFSNNWSNAPMHINDSQGQNSGNSALQEAWNYPNTNSFYFSFNSSPTPQNQVANHHTWTQGPNGLAFNYTQSHQNLQSRTAAPLYGQFYNNTRPHHQGFSVINRVHNQLAYAQPLTNQGYPAQNRTFYSAPNQVHRFVNPANLISTPRQSFPVAQQYATTQFPQNGGYGYTNNSLLDQRYQQVVNRNYQINAHNLIKTPTPTPPDPLGPAIAHKSHGKTRSQAIVLEDEVEVDFTDEDAPWEPDYSEGSSNIPSAIAAATTTTTTTTSTNAATADAAPPTPQLSSTSPPSPPLPQKEVKQWKRDGTGPSWLRSRATMAERTALDPRNLPRNLLRVGRDEEYEKAKQVDREVLAQRRESEDEVRLAAKQKEAKSKFVPQVQVKKPAKSKPTAATEGRKRKSGDMIGEPAQEGQGQGQQATPAAPAPVQAQPSRAGRKKKVKQGEHNFTPALTPSTWAATRPQPTKPQPKKKKAVAPPPSSSSSSKKKIPAPKPAVPAPPRRQRTPTSGPASVLVFENDDDTAPAPSSFLIFEDDEDATPAPSSFLIFEYNDDDEEEEQVKGEAEIDWEKELEDLFSDPEERREERTERAEEEEETRPPKPQEDLENLPPAHPPPPQALEYDSDDPAFWSEEE